MSVPDKVGADEPERAIEPPPPFLGSWKRLYTFVLVSQVVFVVVLFILSELAS